MRQQFTGMVFFASSQLVKTGYNLMPYTPCSHPVRFGVAPYLRNSSIFVYDFAWSFHAAYIRGEVPHLPFCALTSAPCCNSSSTVRQRPIMAASCSAVQSFNVLALASAPCASIAWSSNKFSSHFSTESGSSRSWFQFVPQAIINAVSVAYTSDVNLANAD